MSSSEEYLDSLLKSLMEGDDHADAESILSPAQNLPQSNPANVTETQPETPVKESAAAREHNKAMSVDDIEAMFASMGQETAEGALPTEELAPDDTVVSDETDAVNVLVSDDFSPDTALLPDEPGFSELLSANELGSDELALDETLLSDGLALDETMLPDELTLGETMLPDEPALEEASLPDELALDETSLPDELALDETVLPDELALEEASLPDELALDETMLPDEPALEEATLPDELALEEASLPDELALDETMLPDEPALEEATLPDELALDETMLPDELALDEALLPDELALDETMLPDELILDESLMQPEEQEFGEPSAVDELALEEAALDDPIMDDFALEEDALSDELAADEGFMSGGIDFEEDSASDDLTLDDLDLGDLGLEEFNQDENDMLSNRDGMSEEEIDRLQDGDLSSEDGSDSGLDSLDDFALEESGEDDSDLSELLAGMEQDEDLSEINDLLEKSDQGVAVDDDMLAMLGGVSGDGDASGDGAFDFFGEEEASEGQLENIREITPEELAERENFKKTKKQRRKEEKERKKREKLAKKAARKKGSQEENTNEEGQNELEDLLQSMEEAEDKPKKQGVFEKFLAFLLEEDEDEENAELINDDFGDAGAMIGNLSEENKELLAELKAEDKKNAKKKDKKEKKKGKKGKNAEAGDGAEGEEEGGAKAKKPKKEKKKKKEKNIEEEPQIPVKKLSKKKVISVFLFCATIAACIIMLSTVLPNQMEKQEARVAYDHGQYAQVYELLYGKELSEEDEVLLEKSSIILQVQHKLESYGNYRKLDMPLEALDALLDGVSRYRHLSDDAESYNISGEMNKVYEQVLAELSQNYGISEEDAMDIISSGDDVTYSQRLHAIIYGSGFDAEEEQSKIKQDVLPEEEEIIDRLQNVDEAENNGVM